MKHRKIFVGVILFVCVVFITFTSIKLSDNFSFENESLISNNYLNKQNGNEEFNITNEMLNTNSDENGKKDIITDNKVQLVNEDCEVIEDDLSLTQDEVVEESVEEEIDELYSGYSIEAQEESVADNTEGVTSVTSAEELIEAFKNSTNIRLDSNVTMSATIKINKTINLDLNGYTLESSSTIFSIEENGNLNITAGNDGKVLLSSTGSKCVFNVKGGTLNIKDGIYTSNGNWIFYVASGNVIVEDGEFTSNGKYMIYTKGGKVDLKGGTYTADNGGTYMLVATDGEFNIYGGYFNSSRNYILGIVRSNVNITGGTFTAHDTPKVSYMILINHTAANLNISNANFVSDNKLFYIYGKDRENEANVNITSGKFSSTLKDFIVSLNDNSKLQVTGGKFEVPNGSGIALTSVDTDMSDPVTKLIWGTEGAKEGPSIITNGLTIAGNFGWSSTDITINSGEVISRNHTAVYHPQQGIFTMNGGIIRGATGIDAKMGQFTFNGGYVIGNGEKARIKASRNGFTNEITQITGGSSDEGSAFAIQSELYGSNQSNNGVVGGNDGNISSGHYPDETFGNSFKLTINDGVFISKKHSPVTLYDWNYNGCKQLVNIQIDGGRFSGFPNKYVATFGGHDVGSSIDDNLTLDYLFVSKENTKDGVDYSYVPATYYDGVALEYDFTGKDAPYYASMADAIEDRENDKDARAYIYYLLNNGNRVYNDIAINKQLQITYGKDICKKYIPNSVVDTGLFESDFDAANVKYNESQYVKNNVLDEDITIATLWSPAVTFNSNGGTFEDGVENKTVTVSVASGLIDDEGYGYAEESSENKTYATLDENDRKLELEDKYLLEIPQAPVKDGYEFIGYFYDKEGNEKFDPTTTQIKENLIVYADYKRIRKGGLIVLNTIGGSRAEELKQFEFIISLSDTSINGKYGDVTFVDGIAKFTLKDNESVTISDLPADIKYEITEMGANEEGIVTTVKNAVGTIKDNEVVNSEFNNILDEEKIEEPKNEENNEKIENPKDVENVNTGDNIIVWMVALLSQICIIIYVLRKNLKKSI